LSTLILPSVLLALGCAYAMHVLTAARLAWDGGSAGLEVAMVRVSRPVALSGLTTVIGFLAMATVRISAIRELATYGAVGVFAVTVAALSLAPALLKLWPLAAGGGAATLDARIRQGLRRALLSVVMRRRRQVVIAWAATLALVGVGVARLDVSTDIILWFSESTPVRADYEEIRRLLSGITPVNIVIESTANDRVTLPDVVAAIDALSTELGALPQVGKAISLADPLRQLHGLFTADAEAGLPDDEGLIEQYLVLLEGVPYLSDVLSLDHSAAAASARAASESARAPCASTSRSSLRSPRACSLPSSAW
jgi:predicted RND superfamily exporter protein